MKLIIEGVDNSGKTRLSKFLAKELGLIYINEQYKHLFNFKFEPNQWKFFVNGFNAQTLNIFGCFDNFIKDRFHLSEYVYSEYYNRESFLPFDTIENELLKMSDVLLIFLDSDFEIYQKRVDPSEETVTFENKYEYNAHRKLFIQAYLNSKLKKIHINTSKNCWSGMQKQILYFIEEVKKNS